MGDDPLQSPPCPLGGKERNFPTHFGENTAISQKVSTFSTSDREQNVFVCSFTLWITPFESTLDNWEVMSSILTHDRMKKSNFLRRFQLFRHQTESKMCSLALLHPWFPPSKAPLKIGRSWVQFLLMTEWKKSNFLRRFQLFRHPTES